MWGSAWLYHTLYNRTASAFNSSEPFWGEEYNLHVPLEYQTVSVHVYDHDHLGYVPIIHFHHRIVVILMLIWWYSCYSNVIVVLRCQLEE